MIGKNGYQNDSPYHFVLATRIIAHLKRKVFLITGIWFLTRLKRFCNRPAKGSGSSTGIVGYFDNYIKAINTVRNQKISFMDGH
jgi:hypothetical protein